MGKKIGPNTTIKKSYDKISILRLLLLVSIFCSGLTISILCYYYVRKYQHTIYVNDFNDMTTNSIQSIEESLFIKLQMNIQVALSFGLFCPTIDSWPNCTVSSKEFIESTNTLTAVSKVNDFGLLPIVSSSNRKSFESFALNYYRSDGGYSNTTGSLGIYTVDSNNQPYPSPEYNDTTNYNMFIPILQVSNLQQDSSKLLYDAYSNSKFSIVFNEMITCVDKLIPSSQFNDYYYYHHHHNHSSSSSSSSTLVDTKTIQNNCSGITDYISNSDGTKYVVIGTPIFPVKNKTFIVGFTGALFTWTSILSSTSGVDSSFQVVIESSANNEKLYYNVEDGIVKEKTSLTPFETFFDFFNNNLKSSYVLNNQQLFTSDTQFTITYYSTNKIPSRNIAIISSICCICITCIISLLFEIFNYLIKRKVKEASLLLDSKRVFVRFISHEIRNPLTTIILGLRVLHENLDAFKKSSNQSSEKSEQIIQDCLTVIEEIDENSSVAVATLNDLINYDKIESKTFTIEEKPVDMWAVVEKTVSLLQLQAKEKGVNLILKSQLLTPSQFPQANLNLNNLRINGDCMKLAQVIRNVVSNALKFTPNGGNVLVTAWFESQPVAVTSPRRLSLISFYPKFENQVSTVDPTQDHVGQLIITVTDTGPGLTSEQQKSMFQEGVQFNANELQAGQGSGLGLWISHEIVTLHHGTISVKSEGLGKGSRFEIILPAILCENLDNVASPSTLIRYINVTQFVSEAIKSTNTLSSPNEITKERHVLVVDDAPSNRKFVCRILKSKGFICHEAGDGSKCVEMVLSNEVKYDFILLDFEMPILNGPSAARQLRANKCDTIIVGLTGNVLPEDTAYFLEQGANFVLPKPVKIEELMEKVKYFEARP